MAADGHVEPIVILAKTDLISHDELQQKLAAIKQAGITTTGSNILPAWVIRSRQDYTDQSSDWTGCS